MKFFRAAKKIKSNIPKKIATAKDNPITKIVYRIVSSRLGQFTFFNSWRDSSKNVFNLESIVADLLVLFVLVRISDILVIFYLYVKVLDC